MSRHRSDHQGRRKLNGISAEDFVKKFYKGKSSYCDDYDVVTKNYLIEVKSCDAIIKNGERNDMFGRFTIEFDNHIGLFLHAIMENKVPIYVFILRISNRKLILKKKWDEIVFADNKKRLSIGWNKLF